MQAFWDILPWIFSALSALVMWGTQVNPTQAVSNAAAWAISLGIKDPPAWLKAPDTDRIVRHIAAILVVAGIVYGLAQIFDVGNMNTGPKILFGLCALGMAVSIGWSFATSPAISAKPKAEPQPSAVAKVEAIETPSPLANETLLGFSAQLNVEIRNVAELRRQYIFQHVTPEKAKASFYFSANDQFVFSITDIRDETNSLEVHVGNDGVPIYRKIFLVCETGVKGNETHMRVLVDGVEVARKTIPRRIDLGSRDWTKATVGADIKGKQGSAFTILTWSFGHVTMTNENIAKMNEIMQTYLRSLTDAK